ncbi:MAG TPA: NAD(P)-dependent oxidoreductase [Thermoleophilaceae bacterium]|nr:NAD(P)-dependent oxidoreductase [Thermoleophilaceae bacterium]
MKILLAGATGALGKQLVPRLVAAGHDVTGTTRTESKRGAIESMGARAAVMDALDPDDVANVVGSAEPEVILHQLTALNRDFDIKHFDRTFAETNRLRTEGTDHLLAAGRAVGVKRFIAQSYAGWPATRDGALVTAEDAPLDPDPPDGIRESHDAIRYVEEAVTGAAWTEGIALRYGGFYGPGTSMSAEGGAQLESIRKRKFPVVGDGGGVWSFVHVEDAADATVAAVTFGRRGLYNIVDDEPAPVAEWLPALARAVGAPEPRHVPLWLGRIFAGEVGAVMMTEVRGASNAKAKRELGWQPRHPSWREGFAEIAERAEVAA